MDHFHYREGVLHAEDVALPALADAVGTPAYVYAGATLRRHVQVFRDALQGALGPQAPGRDLMICYAVKANSNLAVLRLLAEQGVGADVVSEGEIRRALHAGMQPERMVFSGVGKTAEEMAFALDAGIFQFNAESAPEVRLLSTVAASKGATARIALRVNPDVDPVTHAKITTGTRESKFGIALDAARTLYRDAATLPGIAVQGVSVHIGSQLTSVQPFRAAFGIVRAFVEQLRTDGHRIDTLDLGGGVGIVYGQETPPVLAEYAATVQETVGDLGCRLMVEPGRVLVGNAGILLTRVLYVKENAGRTFVIVDAAMNDLLRPSLYDAYHAIVPVTEAPTSAPMQPVDIVGPVCESGDTFALQRPLPPVQAGDLLVLRSAGAYGAVMSNTYNSRRLAAEVLVEGAQWRTVRRRQSWDELLALEL